MIYLEKNNTNKVVLTLFESTTICDPFYVFHLTNVSTDEVVIFLANDVTDDTVRYNMFYILEQSNGLDPYTGVINLNPTGQWKAKIYETATESLDPADWGALLQEELVIVAGTDNVINPIYQ